MIEFPQLGVMTALPCNNFWIWRTLLTVSRPFQVDAQHLHSAATVRVSADLRCHESRCSGPNALTRHCDAHSSRAVHHNRPEQVLSDATCSSSDAATPEPLSASVATTIQPQGGCPSSQATANEGLVKGASNSIVTVREASVYAHVHSTIIGLGQKALV